MRFLAAPLLPGVDRYQEAIQKTTENTAIHGFFNFIFVVVRPFRLTLVVLSANFFVPPQLSRGHASQHFLGLRGGEGGIRNKEIKVITDSLCILL